MHKALMGTGHEPDVTGFALHGDAIATLVLGRLVARGLHDEFKGSAYVIVEGLDGRTFGAARGNGSGSVTDGGRGRGAPRFVGGMLPAGTPWSGNGGKGGNGSYENVWPVRARRLAVSSSISDSASRTFRHRS
jgi:hypothetical protein